MRIGGLIESLIQALHRSRRLLSEGVSLDGEYWITPEGDVIDASPGRHAEIATMEMFSKHHGGDQVLRWLNTVPDSYFYMGPAARAHAEIPVPSKEVRAAFAKEIEGVSNGGHPVDFMILERGWIRNYDDAFDVDDLTDKNIKTISELLWSIYHVNPEDAEDKIIFVRVHATKKDYEIRIVDIMNEPESILQRSAFTGGNYYGKQAAGLSESLRGEFWIDDTGQDTFADGDLGDTNHEAYAFWSALGIDPDSKEVRDLDIYPGGGFSRKALKWLRDEGANEDAIKFFQKGGDARDWAMQKMGWIRVDDELFQVYGLDDKKLERIMDFVWEDREYDPDGSITIEDLKTKKSYGIDYSEMDSINTVGDLYRKQDPDIRAPGQPAGKGVLPAGATDEPHFSLDEELLGLFEDLETKIPYLVKSFPDMEPDKAEELVRTISDSDPTENKKYVPWLIRQVKKKSIRLPEDQPRVLNVLTFFNKNKDKKEFKAAASSNIDSYKLFTDLEAVVDKMTGADLKTGHEKRREIKAKGAEKIYDSGKWSVIKVTTPEAAVEYSWGTKWCTSDAAKAERYLRRGPLFIVFENKEKFGQLHLQAMQFMDVLDREIEDIPNELIPVFEAEIRNYEEAISFAHMTDKRIPEWEPIIIKDAEFSQLWGYFSLISDELIGGRWPEAESRIKEHAEMAVRYARHYIKDRWKEAEDNIMRFGDDRDIESYVRGVIKGRWPEYEKYLIDIGDLTSSMAYGKIFEIDPEDIFKAVDFNDMTSFYSKVHDSILKKKSRTVEPEPVGSTAESICRLTSLMRS